MRLDSLTLWQTVDMAVDTAVLPLDYKGPQRAATRRRVRARADLGRRRRLRKWAAFHAQAAPGSQVPCSQQVAVDVLGLLDELED